VRLRISPAVVLLTLLALLASSIARPTIASAQHPVCAGPAAGEVLRTSCRSWAAASVLRFLDDFTVDHLLKPAPPPFERTWPQFLAPFASKNLTEKDGFRALARSLEPLRFTQLDRTTGTVISDLAAAPRQVDVESEGFGELVSLRLTFPEVLEGGYWRGPDVLQIAFWQKHRLGIRVDLGGNPVVQGEIACLILSPDGLLLRFAEEGSAPVFLQLRDCGT